MEEAAIAAYNSICAATVGNLIAIVVLIGVIVKLLQKTENWEKIAKSKLDSITF